MRVVARRDTLTPLAACFDAKLILRVRPPSEIILLRFMKRFRIRSSPEPRPSDGMGLHFCSHRQFSRASAVAKQEICVRNVSGAAADAKKRGEPAGRSILGSGRGEDQVHISHVRPPFRKRHKLMLGHVQHISE